MKNLTYIKEVNPAVLLDEIREVLDIPTLFYNQITHRIDVPVEDEVDEQILQAIVDAHDPTTIQRSELIEAKRRAAKVNAKKIPAWATMTEAEAVAHIQNSVTDLASARQTLIAMARMIVHMRDELWPDLGETDDARI